MSCTTCVWSRPVIADDDETPLLECHRYPPTVLLSDGELVTVRPQVGEEDSCGEYEAAD